MLGKGLFGQLVELADTRIAFDSSIELGGVETFEPGTKARQLLRGKLFNSLFDIFGGGHPANVSPANRLRKLGPLPSKAAPKRG
jgi:hypothetical protein